MRQHDILQRFLFEDTGVRGVMVSLDATLRAVLDRHNYPPAIHGPLGQAMAAAALLGSTIKFDGSLILQVQGDGPVHMLVAQMTHDGHLRGLARWRGDAEHIAVDDMFGAGRLVITIEPGKGKESYQGIVSLQGTQLAESIDTYFALSEQLPTRVWLAADESRAVGMLIQELPHEERDPEVWNTVVHLASTVTSKELLHLPANEILYRLFHEEDMRIFEPEPLSFRCTCSRHRIEEVLLALGYDEVHETLREQGAIKVNCEFCNQHYEFDAVDVEALFAADTPPSVPTTRH